MLEKFYKNNELVFSSNLSISWFSKGLIGTNELLKLKSKIGEKLFLGVIKTHSFGIVFESFYYKDSKYMLDDYIDRIDELRIFIHDIFKKNNINYGIKINLFSTVKLGHGFGITGSFSALISTYLCKTISSKNQNYSGEEKKLALKIERILKNNSSGVDSFFSFYKKLGLSLYVPGKKPELINIQEANNLTLDYYIMYSGLGLKQEVSENYMKKDKENLERMGDYFESQIFKNIDKDYCIKMKKDVNIGVSGSFSLLHVKILKNLEALLSSGFDNALIENFLRSLNQQKNLLSLVGNIDNFVYTLKKSFECNKINQSEKIAIVPVYSGKVGGAYLVCVKQDISRETIDKSLQEVNEDYPFATTDYESFNDKGGVQGIELIQDIDNNFCSECIAKKYVFLDTEKKCIVDDIEEALSKKYDIVFDEVNNDVYIGGVKLDSKDIHSRTTVIFIFGELIKNKKLSNKNLPLSTYSKQKSEMGGKIIYPMRNLVKERLNKKLLVELEGKSSSFNIKLTVGDLNIGILKSIK